MKDENLILMVFIFFVGLWSLNSMDTTQLIEFKTVLMKPVKYSCENSSCEYTKKSDITFTVSRTNQFVTYIEKTVGDNNTMSTTSINKLNDCIVVNEKNFRCEGLYRTEKNIYFDKGFLNTSTFFRWLSDYITPTGKTLNFFEKYLP